MNWKDIRCHKCHKWAKLHEIWENGFGDLVKVTVKCKKCGIQKAEYPCYESIFGFGDENEK